jgi:pyrroloquinoline-quinone synthase
MLQTVMIMILSNESYKSLLKKTCIYASGASMITFQNLATELKPIAQSYNLCTHPFMLRFAKGGFDAEQIQWWAKKMLPGSNRFNQSFLAAIAMASDVQDRVILIDNIYTEHGCLDPKKAHVELYMHFMRSIGCQNISVHADDDSSRVPALAFKRFAVDLNEPFVGVLARFLAIETVLPDMFPMYIKGLRQVFPGITDEAIEYFHIHSVLDPEHQKDLLQVIARNLQSDEDIEIVKHNYGLIFGQLVAMFDYMLLEMDLKPWQSEKELASVS